MLGDEDNTLLGAASSGAVGAVALCLWYHIFTRANNI